MSVLVLAILDRKVVRKFGRPGTVANGVLVAEATCVTGLLPFARYPDPGFKDRFSNLLHGLLSIPKLGSK